MAVKKPLVKYSGQTGRLKSTDTLDATTNGNEPLGAVADHCDVELNPDPHPQYGSGGGEGDMLKSVYDKDNDGVVDAAEAVPWSGITDKPTYFLPEAHHIYHHVDGTDRIFPASIGAEEAGAAAAAVANHVNRDLNPNPHPQYGVPGGGTGDMLKVIYDVDNDGKVDVAELAESVPWSGITGKPTTYSPSAHKTSHHIGGSDRITPVGIGADPAGTADAAIVTHKAEEDPHPQYLTEAEGDERYSTQAVFTGKIPFFTADNVQHNIPLTVPAVPFFMEDGDQHNIPLVDGIDEYGEISSVQIEDGDTTPSMGTLMKDCVYYTVNSSDTTITALHDGDDGCRRTIVILDNHTVFQNGTYLRLNLGEDFHPILGNNISFVRRGQVWYETGRILS